MTKYFHCHKDCPDDYSYKLMPSAKDSDDARRIALREQNSKNCQNTIYIYSMSPGSKKRNIGSIITYYDKEGNEINYWKIPGKKGLFCIDARTGRLGQHIKEIPSDLK